MRKKVSTFNFTITYLSLYLQSLNITQSSPKVIVVQNEITEKEDHGDIIEKRKAEISCLYAENCLNATTNNATTNDLVSVHYKLSYF